MTDEIVVENSLGADGVRRLHVMGNERPGDGWLDYVPDGMQADVKWSSEAGTHHLRVEWRAREMVDMGGRTHGCARTGGEGLRVMLWALEPGKVTPQIVRAAEAYALRTGQDPQYVFMRELPRGADEFVECQVGAGCQVMIVLAGWVPPGFAAIR